MGMLDLVNAALDAGNPEWAGGMTLACQHGTDLDAANAVLSGIDPRETQPTND